jgi:hypothetical protein
MKRNVILVVCCLLAPGVSQATIISHTPADVVPPVVVSPAFGPLAAGGAVGTAAISFGVDYSYGGVEGIFDDGPPLAFGGINASGILDLLSDVDAAIVVPGTTDPGLTSYLWVEAGWAADGSLLLEVFDSGGSLLASDLNGPPAGPHGRTTMEIDRGGVFDIAFFRVSGIDTYGVDQVGIETPVGAVIPAPGAVVLAGIGVGLTRWLRRRRAL